MTKGKFMKLLTSFQMLKKMFKDKNSSKLPKIIVILTLLYLVIPADLIPDFIPVIGLLDDLGILTAGVSLIASLFKRFKNMNLA